WQLLIGFERAALRRFADRFFDLALRSYADLLEEFAHAGVQDVFIHRGSPRRICRAANAARTTADIPLRAFARRRGRITRASACPTPGRSRDTATRTAGSPESPAAPLRGRSEHSRAGRKTPKPPRSKATPHGSRAAPLRAPTARRLPCRCRGCATAEK